MARPSPSFFHIMLLHSGKFLRRARIIADYFHNQFQKMAAVTILIQSVQGLVGIR